MQPKSFVSWRKKSRAAAAGRHSMQRQEAKTRKEYLQPLKKENYY